MFLFIAEEQLLFMTGCMYIKKFASY